MGSENYAMYANQDKVGQLLGLKSDFGVITIDIFRGKNYGNDQWKDEM